MKLFTKLDYIYNRKSLIRFSSKEFSLKVKFKHKNEEKEKKIIK